VFVLFPKLCPEDPTREKAGLIPEYPPYRPSRSVGVTDTHCDKCIGHHNPTCHSLSTSETPGHEYPSRDREGYSRMSVTYICISIFWGGGKEMYFWGNWRIQIGMFRPIRVERRWHTTIKKRCISLFCFYPEKERYFSETPLFFPE
jgi:hypothetical protein